MVRKRCDDGGKVREVVLSALQRKNVMSQVATRHWRRQSVFLWNLLKGTKLCGYLDFSPEGPRLISGLQKCNIINFV
jgi:hypothetical protein